VTDANRAAGDDGGERMTPRMAALVEQVCRSAGRPFDSRMTRGEARSIILAEGAGWLTRNQAREVVCPRCGAEIGELCTRPDPKGRARQRNHVERVRLAARLRHA
jgi:hypothetical protein